MKVTHPPRVRCALLNLLLGLAAGCAQTANGTGAPDVVDVAAVDDLPEPDPPTPPADASVRDAATVDASAPDLCALLGSACVRSIPVPMRVLDMALDESGAVVLGGTWDGTRPLGSLRLTSWRALPVVVWVDPGGALDAIDFDRMGSGLSDGVISVSPTRHGAVWTVRTRSWASAEIVAGHSLGEGLRVSRVSRGGGGNSSDLSFPPTGETMADFGVIRSISEGDAVVAYEEREGLGPPAHTMFARVGLEGVTSGPLRVTPRDEGVVGMETHGEAAQLVLDGSGARRESRDFDGALRSRHELGVSVHRPMTADSRGHLYAVTDDGGVLSWVEITPGPPGPFVWSTGVRSISSPGVSPGVARAIAVTPDGAVVLAVHHEGVIQLDGVTTGDSGTAIFLTPRAGRSRIIAQFRGHGLAVSDMLATPDGVIVVAVDLLPDTRGVTRSAIVSIRP